MAENTQSLPAQHQDLQPGLESEMKRRPNSEPRHRGSGRLAGRTALITGGDSGIGQGVAVAFAREGADVAIVFLDESEDAETTLREIERDGQRGLPKVPAGNVARDTPLLVVRAAALLRTPRSNARCEGTRPAPWGTVWRGKSRPTADAACGTSAGSRSSRPGRACGTLWAPVMTPSIAPTSSTVTKCPGS